MAGSLLLVVTSLLNFSVFLRQLHAGREQVETARRMLKNALQGPEIQLVSKFHAPPSGLPFGCMRKPKRFRIR